MSEQKECGQNQVYVPLHCHSDFSVLDGLQSVGDYLEHCEKNGFKAAALTDHGTCQGLEQFEWYAISHKLHVKPIFGIETYLTDDVNNIMTDRIAKTKSGNIKYDKNGEPLREKQKPRDFNHACLWVQNDKGLENLFKLSTLAQIDGMYYKPRMDLKMLAKHHEGLFVSDGCMLSQVSRAIVADKIDEAYEWEQKLIDIFGKENVLVEIHTWQFCDPKDDNQKQLNANMKKTNLNKIKIARKLGLRMIAVNDAHYAKQSDWKMHDLAWATTTGKGIDFNSDKFEGRGATADWVMTDDEVRYWLGKHEVPADVIEECIQNTSWVADHCNAKLDRRMKPPRFMETREKDEELFDKTVMDGFKELVPKGKCKEYLDRLNTEVELIHKTDLTGYFNIVSDYANFVRADDPDGSRYGIEGKKASILGCGRGSAGGSLVCYLMHITNLDPLRFDLFFERFLTAGRVTSGIHLKFDDGWKDFKPDDYIKTEKGKKKAWQCLDETWMTEYGVIRDTSFDFLDCPDIDQDFEASVIPYLNAYLRKRYGYYGFAQIGTQLQSKFTIALKDIGKVKGMSQDEIQVILSKMTEAGINIGEQRQYLKYKEDFKDKIDADQELKAFNDSTGILDDVWNWAGHYRSVGIHASGYVISRDSMYGKLPLRMKDGKLVTEFEHFGVARLGFIKFDILKLSALGTIRLCYEQIKGAVDVQDIYSIMRNEKLLANPDMWKQTWNGDTLGIFQMDTPLGNKTAMNARMMSLRDAAMLSAADRPGLVRSGLINDFYKVRLGQEQVKHYHPMLDSILDETDGFVLYQEQIMHIYQKMCGMSLEETDSVRKVFAKKRTDLVPQMKTKLYDACMHNKEFIENVPSNYDSPEDCFNDLWYGLSRTAEYCFNKAHAVAYGMVTSIEEYFKYTHPAEFICAYMNVDQDIAGLTYAKVHGIKIAPPNVNKSGDKYVYDKETDTLFMPLWTIDGVGGSAVEEIVRNQPYESFDDYLSKTSGRGGRKKNVLTSLISVGAFDGVDQRDRFQLMVDWKTSRGEEAPKRNTWKNLRIRGKIEEKLLGISLSYDPVFDNKDWLENQGPQSIAKVNETDIDSWVVIAGQVSGIRKHQQKNGKTMAWITVKLVSHEEVTVTMFGAQFEKYKDLFATGDIVALNCKRSSDWNGKLSFICMSMKNHSMEIAE